MEQLPYYDPIPLPRLLGKAVPFVERDFTSGEVARLLEVIGSRPGFRHMTHQALMDLVAAGMGYSSWDALRSRNGAVANKDDLPTRSTTLMDVVAWRMYCTGKVGLREACAAVMGGWQSTSLWLRTLYGDFGQLSDASFEEVRRVALPSPWQWWKCAELAENGCVRLQYAAEMAWDAAALCWTDDCGISLQEITKEILRGASVEIEDLIDDSWLYSDAWPCGLSPLQYCDSHGRLLGYGWSWEEIGARSAAIYGSREAFKLSAIALWKMEPAGQFALKELPQIVTEVEFKNPWDPRDFESTRSDQLKWEIAFEQRNMDTAPWMELHRTDGVFLRLGRDIELGGNLWTAPIRRAPFVDGLLGLHLPSMEDVQATGAEIPWMLDKVPFAIDRHDYEMLCRIVLACDELKESEINWLQSEEADGKLSELLRMSARYSRGGISARSARLMEEPLGTVASFDVPSAGSAMTGFYPELDMLKPEVLGEYALAFYGKNGIRHRGENEKRDVAFMEYAILRNLGVDVEPTHWDEHLIVGRLLRSAADVGWGDAVRMAGLAAEAHKVLLAIKWAFDTLDMLDRSTDKSRLVELGLVQADTEAAYIDGC